MTDPESKEQDRKLVEACVNGVGPAMEELRARHWQPLVVYVRHQLHAVADPEAVLTDVVDDTWLSLSYPDNHRLRAYDAGRGSIEQYLRALARDKIHQVLRQRHGKKTPKFEPLTFDPLDRLVDEPLEQDLLDRFLAILTPYQRDFVLYERLKKRPDAACCASATLRHPESAARAFHPYTQPRSVYSPGPLVSTAARIIRFAVAGNPGQASISRAKSTSFCVSRG